MAGNRTETEMGTELETEEESFTYRMGIAADNRMEWSKLFPLCILFPGHHPSLVTFSMEKQGGPENLSC